jgi:hypothetical protein
MFSLQQNQRTRRQKRFYSEVKGGYEVAQAMYTDVSNCKKDKIKKLKSNLWKITLAIKQ